MQTVFDTIYYILLYPALFFACYYAVLALVGLFFHKQKYPIVEDKLKFCIFVPAHNEADVIAATVNNLAKIKYNPDLFDVFFIADNCTDNTAKNIKAAISELKITNFHCLERNVNDASKKGKPHAMRWGIDLLEAKDEFYNKYDMFMIFDADNFVDSDILQAMNSQYLNYPEKKRPVMIQAYLDSKNKNSLIARGYFVAYRFTNGFLQLPKHKLGLVPGIGGTGYCISTAFLKEIGGYNCTSLVEDLEFETIATLKGKSIAYNHNVRIYDEKPTGLVASAVQKTRWCQGHWYIFFKYSWRLFFKMLNPKEIKFFFKRLDNLMHVAALFFMGISMLITLLPLVAYAFGINISFSFATTLSTWIFYFSIALFPISSLLDGPKKEKQLFLIEFIPNMIANYIGIFVYFYANAVGLFQCKNQTVWKKTVHKVTAMTTEIPSSKVREHKKEAKEAVR
ncbi:MAG: glycosyltransferase family 2 protein [Clostridia bacterium]|nr:glycosyltransferase family 2 protein [Clostridia bacterium]